MISGLKIGTTQAGLVTLESLGIITPKPSYSPYSQQTKLLSGIVNGDGCAVGSWDWGYIKNSQRLIIESYCLGNLSHEIYIRTRLGDLSYSDFSGVLVLPMPPYDIRGSVTLNWSISFKYLVKLEDLA